MTVFAIDDYLAACARCAVRAAPLPPWPDAPGAAPDPALIAAMMERIRFHGIALLLARGPGALAALPAMLAQSILAEAGALALQEASLAEALAPLIEGLAEARIPAIITKGTALAYSLYPDPAIRSRGDTDLLVLSRHRSRVRAVLRAAGFVDDDEALALQENWHVPTRLGFTHVVDLHWRIQASAAASRAIEPGLRLEETIPLPRLSPSAQGIGAIDNLILTAINRQSHARFGYWSGTQQLFETDRLIWAVDFDLLASSFDGPDWDELVRRVLAASSGAAVHSALAFAQAALATPVPGDVMAALAHAPDPAGPSAYFAIASPGKRLLRDVAACERWSDKARLLRFAAFPRESFMRARFPDSPNWPLTLLYVRRWIAGAGNAARSARP